MKAERRWLCCCCFSSLRLSDLTLEKSAGKPCDSCQKNTCRETSHALYLGAGRARIDPDPHRLTRHRAHGEMLGAPSSLCFQLPVASANTTGNQQPPAWWEPLQANTVGLCCDKPLLNSHKAACLPILIQGRKSTFVYCAET